jgi:hypothetical protein
MKRQTLLLIMVGLLNMLALGASANVKLTTPMKSVNGDIPPNKTGVVLNGDLEFNSGSNSVEAYTDGEYLYIDFYQNFGYVNILIMSELGGIAYDNIVNTAVQTAYIIPCSGFITGKYTLILNNANGYAAGDFSEP